MHQYRVWIRVSSTQTAFTIIYADSDWEAKKLAEAQYGVGNVLNYTCIS